MDDVIDRLEFIGGLSRMGLDFGPDSLNLLDDQKVPNPQALCFRCCFDVFLMQ